MTWETGARKGAAMTKATEEEEIDLGLFGENVAKHFPPHSLIAYRGQHVAYNAEGTAIVAHAFEMQELLAKLKSLGIPVSRAPIAWIPGDEAEARIG